MTIKLEIKPSDVLYTKFGIARINERKAINRTDIEELEKAVKERGLLWKNLNST